MLTFKTFIVMAIVNDWKTEFWRIVWSYTFNSSYIDPPIHIYAQSPYDNKQQFLKSDNYSLLKVLGKKISVHRNGAFTLKMCMNSEWADSG